jgi:hypothetical protein
MLSLWVGVATSASVGRLAQCLDDGPWPCAEEGCPSEIVACTTLAELGMCSSTFSDIWDPPPPGMEGAGVGDRCPRACGACGTPPPDACNIDVVHAGQHTREELAAALLGAKSPLLIRSSSPPGWGEESFERLVTEHGDVPVRTTVLGGVYRGDATEQRAMAIRDYPPAMANGTLHGGSYIFYELGGVDVGSGGMQLAGVDVSEAAKRWLGTMPVLADYFASVLQRQHADAPGARDGRLLLSAGTWGNGRPFHAHGPALFAMMAGVKRWFVRRPNASFEWQTFEVSRAGSLRANDELPAGWSDHVWQCSQRPGELLWVPDFFHHATLNYGGLTAGLTLVIDDVTPFTPLHAAAQAGSLRDIAKLLAGGANVDAVARSNGATPIHFAAGLGHAKAVAALIAGGASVDAQANGGLTPLHAAVASDRAEAVQTLVSSGAGLAIVDDHGHTPEQLAVELGHENVARMLKNAQMRRRMSKQEL